MAKKQSDGLAAAQMKDALRDLVAEASKVQNMMGAGLEPDLSALSAAFARLGA